MLLTPCKSMRVPNAPNAPECMWEQIHRAADTDVARWQGASAARVQQQCERPWIPYSS